MNWSPIISEPLAFLPFIRGEKPWVCRRQTIVVPSNNVISLLKMFLVTICKSRQTAGGYNLKCPFLSEEEFDTSRQKPLYSIA